MAFVGEAFLSASVEKLLDSIIPHEFLDMFRSKEIDVSLLQKLKITLLSLQVVLTDAEEKQITDAAVKEWLHELKYAVFDAEDLLDEINTEGLRCKVEGEYQKQTITAKVRNFLSSPLKRFKGGINSEMKALFQRLEQFALQKDVLGLKEGVSSEVWHGTRTSSVVDESAIYGRDDDKKKLKHYLLSEDASGGGEIGVVSIVGMGGLGKTTLAKLLYNDHEVKEKFDLKGWAHISKDFDVCRVTKTLLESVSSKPIVTNNLNTLQVELQQRLNHKRYLLVLDDIWDGSYDEWSNLKAVLNAGKMGSKIIITTRDESVARIMQTFLPIHYLRSLPTEECWALLASHAFGSNNCSRSSNLEVIGKEIANKCGGLPLAAKAIGGLLRTKLLEKEWNDVLKSNIWDLPNVKVLPALLLSYHYLPASLKQCFAYCSIFPKNSEFVKKMVVQLWIAEGLVHQSKSEKTMEEVGEEYFDELVSRSLIRRSINEQANFQMHDLINDLATMVSSAYCIRYGEQKPHQSLDKFRHLSYNRGRYDYFNKFDTFHRFKCLRTFLALPLRERWRKDPCYLANKVVHDLLPTMRQLRVLSLSNYKNISELPNSLLENLIHLRYLDLSYTKIERLPYATSGLCNLQTLLLSFCDCLTELPKDMGKLVNLRHLDIRGTKLKMMPLQLARLKHLQTLSSFVISKVGDGLKIGELRKFPHLQGKLSILKLQNVPNPYEAFQSSLKNKDQIEELTLEWDYGITPQDREIERLVLEHLRPSTNLKKLNIRFYGGTSFPNWLGDSSFGNMVYLEIHGCDRCLSLPPLGLLLSLKELIISGLKSMKTVGAEFYGCISFPSFQPFPSLEMLRFKEMPEWEEWNLIAGTNIEFPGLRQLCLRDCPKLKGNLPRNLPSLTNLDLSKCPLLESHSSGVDNSNIMRPLDLFSEMMLHLNYLRDLTIEGIPSLRFFPRDGLPKTIRYLSLHDCEKLEFLPNESLRSCTLLEHLTIWNSCSSLASFPLGCLPVLKSLYLWGCKNLKSISLAEEKDPSQSLTFLQVLSICDCPELQSFPQGGLPTPNLMHLTVYDCEKLKSLPEPINTLTGLQALTIYGLPSLQSFAKEGLPINLRELYIGSRGIFSNSAVSEWGLQRLTCLSELRIGGDYLANALMRTKVPLLPASLVSLHVCNLGDVKCLDGKWLQHLTSLEYLEILWCPRLESLAQEGLPFSLSALRIFDCPLLEASWQSKGGKEWHRIAHSMHNYQSSSDNISAQSKRRYSGSDSKCHLHHES